MQAYLVTIVCKFGGDRAICLREEAICAKVYRRTDGRTDDGRRAIALAHSWNELNRSTILGHVTIMMIANYVINDINAELLMI